MTNMENLRSAEHEPPRIDQIYGECRPDGVQVVCVHLTDGSMSVAVSLNGEITEEKILALKKFYGCELNPAEINNALGIGITE
tara:strand:+ start:157 stop:405 length:249 start_codon:yes stop_codon:yes gene_type:complete